MKVRKGIFVTNGHSSQQSMTFNSVDGFPDDFNTLGGFNAIDGFGTHIFWSKGGPSIYSTVRGEPEFLEGQRGGTKLFSKEGGQNFYAFGTIS